MFDIELTICRKKMPEKKKILFIDRDGTLIHEPESDKQVDSLEKLRLIPGVIRNLYEIAASGEYLLVMVSNQDGLGTPSFPEPTFWPAHLRMMEIFEGEGIVFHAIHIDRTFAHEGAPTRKPGTAMLKEYMEGTYDLENSFVIGDRITDLELAKNLGARGILFNHLPESAIDPALMPHLAVQTTDWETVKRQVLHKISRSAHISRITKETQVEVDLNLDGRGETHISTGIGFFDHMLDQLGKHSGMDLKVKVEGDLHIDEHHTIEDTAIALGEAMALALGDKRGIERYGCFTLPMDEAQARVALDFSGRSYLVYEVNFHREKVGDFPTEMLEHFFKSFCDSARCNLHISATGGNAHHVIEAIFKGVARSIKQSKLRDPFNQSLPTTKGIL